MSYHVVVEQEPLCEVSTFLSAIVHLIGSYYIYHIAYPKPLNSLLIMIQHFIFGIKDSQRDPVPVIQTVTSLKHMDN